MQLYDYQQASVESIVALLDGDPHRIVLCLPTGAGKTEIACEVIRRATAMGLRSLFVVDRNVLVQQTSARFAKYGIPHDVRWNKWSTNYGHPVVVGSAPTMEGKQGFPAADLIFVDECHTKRKATIKHIKQFAGTVVGLSATPIADGLAGIYTDGVISPKTTKELITDGRLAPYRLHAAKEIDMRGAKTSRIDGEWLPTEVEERSRPIIGDIVQTWIEYVNDKFGGPVKTLVFSATVKHGDEICAAFQAAGYDFRQSSYQDSGLETTMMIDDFRAGKFVGLVSVDKFVKGFDVPDVRCIVGARPYTTSLMSFVQQLGRGLRTADGKEYLLYIDHAGNAAGWLYDLLDIHNNGVKELLADPPPRKRKDGLEDAIICGYCKHVNPYSAWYCEACGFQLKTRVEKETVEAESIEEVDVESVNDPQWFLDGLITYARWRNYKPGWAYHKFVERFGLKPQELIDDIPYGYIQDSVAADEGNDGPPPLVIMSFVNSSVRKWRRRQQESE